MKIQLSYSLAMKLGCGVQDVSSNQAHSGVYGRIPHRVDGGGANGSCDPTISKRVDCGMAVGKNQESCEAAGCCWTPNPDPNPNHAPWCYHASGGTGGKNRYWAEKKAMLLLGLVFTCPGSPMLLQGQELLTYDSFDFPTPPKMDWSLADSNAGMLRETKALVAIRTNRHGNTRGLVGGKGKVLSANDTAKVGVIHRWSDGSGESNDVVVVYNMKRQLHPRYRLTAMPYDGPWTVRFSGDDRGYSDLFTGTCTHVPHEVVVKGGGGEVCVPPMSMVVLSRGSHGGSKGV